MVWGLAIAPAPILDPTDLTPRYYGDIRIQRVQLYSNSQTVYLRPDSGLYGEYTTVHCFRCGVGWVFAPKKQPLDLLSCAVIGYDRTTCWSCGDQTFLPPEEDGETYDLSWYPTQSPTHC